MTAVARLALDEGREAQLLRCRRDGCGQALGVRLPSGRLKLFGGPEVDPSDGHLHVACPACGKRFYLRLNHGQVIRVEEVA